MKKLLLLIVMLASLTAQGQEYFSREYNKAIIKPEGKEIFITIKVEFNVFRTSDILVRMGDEEPARYVQVGDAVDPRGEGLDIDFQYVNVKLAGTNHLFQIALYDTGEVLIWNEQTNERVVFTNE